MPRVNRRNRYFIPGAFQCPRFAVEYPVVERGVNARDDTDSQGGSFFAHVSWILRFREDTIRYEPNHTHDVVAFEYPDHSPKNRDVNDRLDNTRP